MTESIKYVPPLPAATPVLPDSPVCQSSAIFNNYGYLCTREIGHQGNHEAGFPNGKKLAEWTR